MITEASAPANIAVIKYMGKTDSENNRPTNSSLSLTLDELRTYVEISFDENKPLSEDKWEPLVKEGCDQPQFSEASIARFLKHFQFLKKHWSIDKKFLIRSCNNFPSDCGLASSASSFAALTKASSQMFQKLSPIEELGQLELSDLSRKGSGSSCRSFFGPWTLWYNDGVRPIEFPFTGLLHQVVIVSAGKKEVSSSQAHRRVTTSSLFDQRAQRAERRLAEFIQAMEAQHWDQAYEICWSEFWDMHALFETSKNPFGYMRPETLEVLDYAKILWRDQKDGPLVTMDAGANVHFIWRHDQKNVGVQTLSDLGHKFSLHGNLPELWKKG